MNALWVAVQSGLLLADEPAARARPGLLGALLVPAVAVLIGAAIAISGQVRSGTRTAALDGFVLTARLRGLPTTGAIVRRLLRRMLPALATLLAAEVLIVFCGTVIVQDLVAGASSAAVTLPVVLGCVLVATAGIVLGGLAVAVSRLDGTGASARAAEPTGGAFSGTFTEAFSESFSDNQITDDDPVLSTASMPSTDFRATDVLDIRDLNIDLGAEVGDQPPGEGINLTVSRGQALAVIGDSDSGTAQVCRAIVGVLPRPSRVVSGSILFDGRELVALPEREFRRLRGSSLGFLDSPSADRLDPRAPVGRELVAVLTLRTGVARAGARRRAVELLDRVGVAAPEVAFGSYPHQLSAVTAHRVLLAGAIAGHPQLLIAVDPTAGFEADAAASFLDLLHGLQRERGFTLIVASSRADVVTRCDRVAVMRAGTIVEHASVSELLTDPKHPHSRYLVTGGSDPTRPDAD